MLKTKYCKTIKELITTVKLNQLFEIWNGEYARFAYLLTNASRDKFELVTLDHRANITSKAEVKEEESCNFIVKTVSHDRFIKFIKRNNSGWIPLKYGIQPQTTDEYLTSIIPIGVDSDIPKVMALQCKQTLLVSDSKGFLVPNPNKEIKWVDQKGKEYSVIAWKPVSDVIPYTGYLKEDTAC